jgi:hypothetical protein
VVLGGDRVGVGIRDQRVHAHERLPRMDSLAFAHQDFLDDARFGRLDDLEIALRHELAFGHRDDIQLPDQGPEQQQPQQDRQSLEHCPPERIGHGFLQAQEGRCEVERVGLGLREHEQPRTLLRELREAFLKLRAQFLSVHRDLIQSAAGLPAVP